MGFTHYWTLKKEIDQTLFDEIKNDFMEIMKVSDWIDDVEIGIDNDDLFRFNGKGDDAHEDLFFQRTPNSEFCKTDRKPYDIAVRVFLGLAKYKLKRNLELSTDDNDSRIFYKAFKKYSKLKKA